MIHFGLQRFDGIIGTVGKFVVGIPSQFFIFVFQVLLKELQTSYWVFRERIKLKNIILSGFGNFHRCRPHQFRRINRHDQERSSYFGLSKINGFDCLSWLHQLFSFDNRHNLKFRPRNLLAFGELSPWLDRWWKLYQLGKNHSVHGSNFFGKRLRRCHTEWTSYRL